MIIVAVVKLLMKLNKTLLIKGITMGMELISFFLKKDVGRYSPTIINVIDASHDVGMTVLTSVEVLKDKKITPEEELELAERLTNNKRSLDNALTSLIKDLKEHALHQTEEKENA
jgi:hypothetical protein